MMEVHETGAGYTSRIHPSLVVNRVRRRPAPGGVAGTAVFYSAGDAGSSYSDVIDGGDPDSSSAVLDGGSV